MIQYEDLTVGNEEQDVTHQRSHGSAALVMHVCLLPSLIES